MKRIASVSFVHDGFDGPFFRMPAFLPYSVLTSPIAISHCRRFPSRAVHINRNVFVNYWITHRPNTLASIDRRIHQAPDRIPVRAHAGSLGIAQRCADRMGRMASKQRYNNNQAFRPRPIIAANLHV
jgi:hypothetical protein